MNIYRASTSGGNGFLTFRHDHLISNEFINRWQLRSYKDKKYEQWTPERVIFMNYKTTLVNLKISQKTELCGIQQNNKLWHTGLMINYSVKPNLVRDSFERARSAQKDARIHEK